MRMMRVGACSRRAVGVNTDSSSGRLEIVLLLAITGAELSVGGELKQYWTFDDGSGSVASNAVAGGNAGALINYTGSGWGTDVAAALASRSSGSLSFASAATNYVNGGPLGLASTGGVDGASVSFWLKPGALAGDMRLWGPQRRLATAPSPQGTVGLWLDGSGNGTLRAFHWTQNMWTNISYAGAVKTNQWQHLGFTWRGKHMIAYLNGNVVGGIDDCKFEFDHDVLGEAVSFGIGAKYFNYGVSYDGKMDDLSIWGSTLSPEQVRTLASGQSPFSVPSSAGAKAPPKPLAEYRLDGNARDVRGKYNGSAVNGASFTNGFGNTPFEYVGNMALRLDGVNDEVTLTNAAALRPGTNAWTLSVWFKAAATNQLGTVMAIRKSTSPSTQMSVYVGGTAVGTIGSGMRVHSFVIGTQSPQVGRWETYTTGQFLDDRWHHVALVRTCNTLNPVVYVDGEVTPFIGLSSTPTLLDVDSTDPWRIGANGVAGTCFSGLIDEAALWNTALSGEQVAWLAQNSLSAIPPVGTLLCIQ